MTTFTLTEDNPDGIHTISDVDDFQIVISRNSIISKSAYFDVEMETSNVGEFIPMPNMNSDKPYSRRVRLKAGTYKYLIKNPTEQDKIIVDIR